ncbi:NtrZ family periplasmic regulatory protein [Phenylobacterium sp.]|uniref:NtrZ family periplasmic regulatory protein n=1 Tax=Phenylobacterium sp. TaxID=1871053 RepID=UPI002F92F7E3
MTARRIMGVIATAALFGAGAGAAHAADKKMDFTVRQEAASPIQPNASQTMKWDARKGRWGLTLNLEQPAVRPSTLNDVEAGAYYRITPSIRVGGAVALGEEQLAPGPKKPEAAKGQPRVRLETNFKF